MNLKQALEIVKELRPDYSIFVNKELRSFYPHDDGREHVEIYSIYTVKDQQCKQVTGESLEHCIAKIRAEIAPDAEKNEE